MARIIPPGVAKALPRPIATRNLNWFSDHASVEDIQEQINARRAEVRPLERHIEWLEDLLARREQHIANGGRPPVGLSPRDEAEMDASADEVLAAVDAANAWRNEN